MSNPPSNSFVRSGLSALAGFVTVGTRPPLPLCVGVRPVPCEMVPAKYNDQTELSFDVKEGKNRDVDFDLNAP